VKVKFNASRDAMSFDVALLAEPLRTASASLAEVLELKMKTLEPTGDDFMQRARATVLALLDKQDASLQSAASKLAMSRRTLQRELQRRNSSHQALVDDARRSRARELLEAGFAVADVSEKLGFSEPSAFFRAFRRWTGHTPREARSR
jgi:AraC-like DNA-binding protein